MDFSRRAPRGARGLKLAIISAMVDGIVGRAPRGARGLKRYLATALVRLD